MLTCDAVSAARGAVSKTGAADGDAPGKSNAGTKTPTKNGPSGSNSGGFNKGAGGKNGGGVKKGNGGNNGGKNGANGNGGSAANTSGRPDGAASAQSGAAAVVAQEKCSWTLPVQIGNDIATDGVNTLNLTVNGSQSSDTGTHTSNTNTSDQFTLSFTGTSLLDGGETRSRQGTWKFTGATGSLKGITGTGTYTAAVKAEGGISYDLEGNYQLPSATPAVAPALGTPTPGASASTPKPVS
jgi:hypothetical protein